MTILESIIYKIFTIVFLPRNLGIKHPSRFVRIPVFFIGGLWAIPMFAICSVPLVILMVLDMTREFWQ
jgi:hypothetical protein